MAVRLDVKLPPQIMSLASTFALATAEHQRLSPDSFADKLLSPISFADKLVSICNMKSESTSADAHSKSSVVEHAYQLQDTHGCRPE